MSSLSCSAELRLEGEGAVAASDHELLAAIAEGNEEAFQEIVSRYRNQIVNFLYRMLNDYDRAVELSQETFLRIFTSASKYQATYSFSTYIYRIASNLAISELRQRKRRQWISIFTPFGGDEDNEREMELPDKQPLQDETMIDGERRKAVATAIQSLPEKYRLTLVLRDVEGLSYERITEITGLSEG